MTKLPWRETILSGFRLVARRPAAALSWALVSVVIGTIMAGLQVWAWRGLDAGRDLSAAVAPLGLYGLVLGVLSTAVSGAAILRAEVSNERLAAWPRFGGDELRLLVLVAPLSLAIIVIGSLIGVTLMSSGFMTPSPFMTTIGIQVATTTLTLVGARLALAAPMTIAEGRLRLGGALGLSQGLHARLATILVAALALSVGIEWAGSWGREALADALGIAQEPVLRAQSLAAALDAAFGPAAFASRTFGALVHALAFAVQVAPIGYAYRQLTDSPADRAAVF